MLFGGIVTVYCENHTEHTDTYKLSPYLIGNTSHIRYRAQSLFTVRTVRNIQIHINSVRTLQETHHISTEPNRLMLCGETVAVYCENCTEHTDTYKLSPYLTRNTSHLYRAQPVNAVWRNSRCLQGEPYGTYRYI
jgi:hypothetical protein